MASRGRPPCEQSHPGTRGRNCLSRIIDVTRNNWANLRSVLITESTNKFDIILYSLDLRKQRHSGANRSTGSIASSALHRAEQTLQNKQCCTDRSAAGRKGRRRGTKIPRRLRDQNLQRRRRGSAQSPPSRRPARREKDKQHHVRERRKRRKDLPRLTGDPTTSTAPSGSGKAPHCCSLERETRADAGMEVEAGGGRERGYGNSGSAKAQEGIGAWGFLAASLRWCPWAWADGGFRSSSKR